MTGKEGQTANSSSQDNYEATVLDFLEKEMSAVQPSQKPKEYSEELDELVSDLLKQAIHEADQKKPVQNAGIESLEDLIAELTPVQEVSPSDAKMDSPSKSGLNSNKAASQPMLSEAILPETSKPVDVESSEVEKPAKTGDHKTAGSLFASPAANKRKTPVIAIAFVGLLAIVGGSIYYFSNSTGSESKQAGAQPAATQLTAPSGESNPLSAQNQKTIPQAQAPASPAPSASQPVAADSSKRAADSATKNAKASEVKTVQAPVASAKNTRGSEAAAQQPAASSATLTPAPPRMETPAPPVAASPAVSNNNAPAERQAEPVASENTRLPEAVAENKPVQIVPGAPKPESSAPVSIASSTPETRPNIPAAAKNPSPAVPISRANPQFPELAVRARSSGTVVLDVSIDSQGKVTKAIPVSGPSVFHNEAIKAAMKWRYKPASIEGTNVPSQNRIIFNFNLKQ